VGGTPKLLESLHPGVKISKDPDGSCNHDEQDETGEQNQLQVFPLLAFERQVQEEAEMHDQLKDRTEDENDIDESASDCRYEGEGDNREDRGQHEPDQVMTEVLGLFNQSIPPKKPKLKCRKKPLPKKS
jgi:hypothetical protein